MTDNRPYVELEFTGDTLTQHSSASNPLVGTNIVIDYGDGTTVNYNGNFSHTYSTSGDYTIRIYGVTSLGDRCFYGCSGLTSVKLSNIITSLGELCFYGCSGLTSIRIPNSVTIIIKHCFLECSSLTKIFFEWSSSTDIITYDQYWFSYVSSIDLIIPMGTTSLYTAKGYPSNRLYAPVLFGSLKIGGKTVKALQIAGKLIQSITRVNDGKVLYHTPSWIKALPSVIQSGDTTDVYANIPLRDSGYKVHFFERVTPVFTLLAEPNPIQSGDTSDVYAIVKDSDGSRVVGEPVYFFTDKVLNALSVSSDKDVLSYADGDKAVLTATLTGESVSGKSVVFKKGSTVLATETTDSSGEATYEYTSEGAGDVTLTVECENITKTITIEDCTYFNDGSSVGSLEFGSNVSCTSNGEYITITTSTSGEKDIKLPVELSGDWEYDVTLAENMASGSQLTFKIGTGQQWGGFNANNTITVNLGSSQNFNKTVQKGMILKITYINGVMTVYWNNEQLASKSLTLSSGVKMGYYTNNGRYQYIKDLKLKPL